MGYSRFDPDDWDTYSTKTASKPAAAVFKSVGLHEDLDPLKFKVRESRDSVLNPESTAVIVGFDETGSMGHIPEYFVKTGLGILFQSILDRKPVTDPHLMVMGIGDAECGDKSPIQVSQFESDISITNQIEKVHLEHGGGGNGYESYELPWYIARFRTSIDCFEKRNKKGYLFTIGDEPASKGVIKSQVKKFIGDAIERNIPLKEMYEMVSKMYNTYHIIIAEGYYQHSPDEVRDSWLEVMGENAIILTDYTKLSELITSIIEVNEGRDKATVTASWSGDTSLVIAKSLAGYGNMTKVADAGTAVVRF